MYGMKNMSSMGLFWMWQWSSQICKRCIIHSNSAWHSLLFCETWHSHTCWRRLRLVGWWRVTDVL